MKNEAAMRIGNSFSKIAQASRLPAFAARRWTLRPLTPPGPAYLFLLLILIFSACGGGGGLLVEIRDWDNNPVAGVEIRQVGADNRLLGTTDDEGKATIRPERGDGEVYIKLNRPTDDGREFDLSASIKLPEGDFQAGVRVIRIKEETGPDEDKLTTSLLRITSEPPGTEVWINGERMGVTPTSLPDLNPGRTLVVLTKQGWHPDSTELLLEAGGEWEHHRKLSPREVKTASLELRSDPPGAAIYLDGSATRKTTPTTLTGLQPGRHRVRASLSGYEDTERTVRLKAGRTDLIEFIPVRKAGNFVSNEADPDPVVDTPPVSSFSKQYSVSTAPYFAEVYVDGSDQNLNILGNFNLTLNAGVHRFRVKNSQLGIDRILRYEVVDGDPNNKLILDLQKGAVRAKRN
jgi:hypothetical protein